MGNDLHLVSNFSLSTEPNILFPYYNEHHTMSYPWYGQPPGFNTVPLQIKISS